MESANAENNTGHQTSINQTNQNELNKLKDQVFSPTFDLSKQYASYANVLPNAVEGKVVTRFPPEPSGYLHIGHVKALLLNYHYSRIYKGKMILRFDDTNPTKEKEEFVQSIMEDMATLQVKWDQLTYSSDHFEECQVFAEKLITEGKAYCDDTPVEKMRAERQTGVESARRSSTPEENMKIWAGMLKGENDQFCLRAKIDMQANNKCLRDPVLYRVVNQPHHRTGTKYKAYPTYDFACPIIDSVEGVTHCLRTNEYHDRNAQYKWVQQALGVREVIIYDFSRLNLVNTCLSKRKLQWFVDTGRVESWEDPRFPTVRGILRRGLRVETLIEFMLEQGPSKNTNLMEWDKLWAINQRIIDPIAGRYCAIPKEGAATLHIINGPAQVESILVPLHPKLTDFGQRPLFKSANIILEKEDASELKEGEKVTLMKWGNVLITKINRDDGGNCVMEGEFLENDKDFKSTKKLTWLPNEPSMLSEVLLVEYDHLLNAKKVEEDVDFMSILNENSKQVTLAWADPAVKNLPPKANVQFERRGYFVIDRSSKGANGSMIHEMIFVPDGKTKTMSNLSTKVDQKKVSAGGNTVEGKKKAK